MEIVNPAFARNVIILASAATLGLSVIGASSGFGATAPLLKRRALLCLFPIFWMILQIVPMPYPPLVNQIWTTTATALNQPGLTGHISIDVGATLRSLFWYLSLLSLAIATVLITKDRQRAERTFLVVTGVTTLMAAWLLLGSSAALASSYAFTAGLAALTNGGLIWIAVERFLIAGRERSAVPALLLRLLFGVAGMSIAVAAILIVTGKSLLVLVALGFAMIFFVIGARRARLRPWPAAIVAAILLVVLGAANVPSIGSGFQSWLVGLTNTDTSSVAIAQRALTDAPALGTGVGTYHELAAVYREFGGGLSVAPSTAIAIAVEWGRIGLAVLCLLAFHLSLFALRGAVTRGRDAFFAATASAGIMLALCASFLDSGLSAAMAPQVILAVLIGIGIAQSAGRTTSV